MKVLTGLLFFYLVLFPFGQLIKLPFFLIGPEVHLYLSDILMGGLVGSWLLFRNLRIKKLIKEPLFKPVFLFSGFALFSLIINSPLLSAREVVISWFYWLRWLIYVGFYFLILDLRKTLSWLNQKFLWQILLILGTGVAVFGLIQYFFWPNLQPLEFLAWDPHYYRVVGSFLDPGFTGLILALSLILLWGLFYQDFKKPKLLKRFSVWLFLLIYSVLALTYSRSSYLAYLVGMAILAWLKKRPKFFLIIFALGLATLLFLPRPQGEGGKLSRRYSIEARFESWQNALKIAKNHPWFGVGFNSYRYAQRDYGFLKKEDWQLSHSGAGVDSSFLLVLATTGLLGLTSYLWLWFLIIKLAWEKRKTNFGQIGLASFGAILAHSFFLNCLFYPWLMAWLWLFLATENK